MRATVLTLLLALLATAAGTLPVHPASAAPDDPVVSLVVEGGGASLRPAFDPAISRYGLAAGATTDGSITVEATTTDPAGTVLVDGRPVTGPTQVTGLSTGDEVSVIVDDAAGRRAYALVYLPADFPALSTVVDEPGRSAGEVLLTLGRFSVVVDHHGVPVHVRDHGTSVTDLKPAPGGHYTLMRRLPGPASNWDLVELDGSFEEVATYRTVGLVNTDNHDAILRPDGSRMLVAYEPDPDTGLTDAVIQEVDAEGQEVYTWDSGDHLDRLAETTAGSNVDWAHINAIQVLPDGDVLASFRHLSAVLKIAWSDHDGFTRGDVVWRLGGRLSDFTFPDDPYGGPCAQHTAAQLEGGTILIFDNGSSALGANPSYCVDPADRAGPTVDRPTTRVTEYALDEVAGTATLVSSYEPGRYAYFAGSARRLEGGNTLVSWAAERDAVASEVTPAGETVWELFGPTTFSYRAEKAVVPDVTDPEVTVALPAGGRYDVGDEVEATVSCTDRGGSTLQECSRTTVDTSTPGTRTFTVTAVDGAGNTTVVEQGYRVTSPRPTIEVHTDRGWADHRTLRLTRRGAEQRAVVQVVNRSVRPGRLYVRGQRTTAAHRFRYLAAGRDVTRAVVAGTWRTPSLAPGRGVRLEVFVTRRTTAAVPDRRVRVVTGVPGEPGLTSAVTLGLRSR